MDNTNIETQPIGRIEAPIIPEVSVEVGSVETSFPNAENQQPSRTEVPSTKEDFSLGAEISIETPKPSAGFPINPESTGNSRIVLEKIIGKIENL